MGIRRPLRKSRRLARTTEFVAWIALASGVAVIAAFDAITEAIEDHNNFGDVDHFVEAAAWLTLAGWAATRGLESLPSPANRARRRWFISMLLLAACPFPAIVQDGTGYAVNAFLLAVAFLMPVVQLLRAEPAVASGQGGDGPFVLKRPDRSQSRRPASPKLDEIARRKAFFKAAAELTSHVSVDVDELRFFVSTRDRDLGGSLFTSGTRADIKHLRTAVEHLARLGIEVKGTTFVDVGANIGTTTVAAIRRHGFGHAISLEPAPDNFWLLRVNAAANEIDARTTVLPVAVGDKEGVENLVLSKNSSGQHLLAPNLPKKPAVAVPVRVVALDDVVRQGLVDPAAVGLVWIDAPWQEARVLNGASLLAAEGVPIVFAIRKNAPDWEETRRSVATALAGYSDFVELRREKLVRRELDTILDCLTSGTTDILAVRRPRS